MILPAEVSTEPEGKTPFWLGNLRYRWQQELSEVPPEEANDIIEIDHVSLVGGRQSADLLLVAEPVHSVLHAALPFRHSREHSHSSPVPE